MELNEIIKTECLDLGLSQEVPARELHVGFTSVNHWENYYTKRNRIALHTLIELKKIEM